MEHNDGRGLVHDMVGGLTTPDWPSLTDDEVHEVLLRYGVYRSGSSVNWPSPRPMSAAGIVQTNERSLFVKRHHRKVRSPQDLELEHALARHLRNNGVRTPNALTASDGSTVVQVGEFCYEVQELIEGVDLYRDAMSWTPYASLGHARSAGAALARFHRAATTFSGVERPPGMLMNSVRIIASPDPLGALEALLVARPGLGRAAGTRKVLDDFSRLHLERAEAASQALSGLPRLWGHGDWHGSNLSWDGPGDDAKVVGVFDLGLSNLTYAVHDLAIALERSAVDWLELKENASQVTADLKAVDAILDGYESIRPLVPDEVAALVSVLPVAHVEYALSEVEYFGDVVGSEQNTKLAYAGYFLGHTAFFDHEEGKALLDQLRSR